uniref:Head-tail adaptor n=1 Tax=Microbacterium phage Merry TaxID=3144827 RepID=A0AAU7J7W1_9VIRU
MQTPCSWDVTYADCAGRCDTFDRWPEADRASAQATFEAMAVEFLWNATNRMFGVCQEELRPCRQDCAGNAAWATTFWGRGPGGNPGFPRLGAGGMGGGAFYPVLVSGQWFNVTCGCLGKCSCSPTGPSVLSLPGPAVAVTEVTIDGVTVDPETYRLDRGRWLVREDGSWPGCQDMNVPADAVGSFVVRYQRGVPVPVAGQVAAGRLACELAMAACGDEDCALPDNWQTLTRQGITINADPNQDGSQVTGIWSIDEWIKQVNRPRSFASVRSVDVPNLG